MLSQSWVTGLALVVGLCCIANAQSHLNNDTVYVTNYKDCLYFYVENITGTYESYKVSDDGKVDKKPSVNSTFHIAEADAQKPEIVDAKCFHDLTFNSTKEGNSTAYITLIWNKMDSESSDKNFEIEKIELQLGLWADNYRRYWQIVANESAVSVYFKNDKEPFVTELNIPPETSAATFFSWSCSQQQFATKWPPASKTKDDQYIYFTMYLNRFQLQPFEAVNTTKGYVRIFANSFDCAQWMTLATWSGLIFLLLFTIILASGVWFLMDLKAPDRFEDPKGKQLVINVAE